MKLLGNRQIKFMKTEQAPLGFQEFLNDRIARVPAELSVARPPKMISKPRYIVITANTDESYAELLELLKMSDKAFEAVKQALLKKASK